MAGEWYDFDFGGGDYDTGSSSYTYTPSSTTFTPDYSFGTSGSSYGLQSPSYGGGGGGTGLSLPSDFSYGGGYSLYGGSPSYTGGSGISAPSFGGGGGGGSFGGGSSFTAAPSIYAMPGGGVSLASMSPSQVGAVGGAPGMRVQQGSFAPSVGAGAAPTAPTGQAGLTGSFGGAGTTEGAGAATGGPGLLERFETWGKENPRTASFLSQGVGALAGEVGRQRAAKLMEQQAGMQRDAMQSQRDALAQNNALAGQWNAQSAQSMNEARSLYNPQELAIRGMAQQTAATGRREQETYANAIKRGLSPADAAAEARRVRLAGSTAATTGYMAGLDLGRQAQQGALSGAKALGSPYAGLQPYSPTATMANAATQQYNATGGALTNMLDYYLGNPTLALTEARRKAMQEEAAK